MTNIELANQLIALANRIYEEEGAVNREPKKVSPNFLGRRIDIVDRFLDADEVTVTKNYKDKVSGANMYMYFMRWIDTYGYKGAECNATDFGVALQAAGIEKTKGRNCMWYRGIKVEGL